MSGIRSLLGGFLRSREAYNRVGPLLGPELGEQEKTLLSAIGEFYERDPAATAVDPELVTSAIARSLPNPKHQAQFSSLVKVLWDLNVSAPNVVHDYIEVKRSVAGSKLATALAAGKSGEEVAPLMAEYEEWANKQTLDEAPQATFAIAKSVRQVVAERVREGGLIRIAPAALNERLGGGLMRGHHLILFARPEVGKTLVLLNMTCVIARNGLKVLYVSNEDPLDDIVMRAVCRLADVTRSEVMEDPEGTEQVALANGYSNIVFAELAPGTPAEIEALVEEHKPDVVVIDQLRNLNVGEDNFVRALEKAASAVRNLGKRRNCLVISATQAGDSASGKSVLDMGDVDNSNTGIPAQADVLLGVGMSPDDEARGMRVLSLCKNKPGGNHDYFAVSVEPAKSKVTS